MRVQFMFISLLFATLCAPPTPNSPSKPVKDMIDFNVGDSVMLSYFSGQSVSRRSAVQVITGMGMGSGTYIKYRGNYLVLTAEHVVSETDEATIVGRDREQVGGEVVYRDEYNDIAILLLATKLETRKHVPLSIKKKEPKPGDILQYTGFPNNLDLLTFDGKVAGYSRDRGTDRLMMHSFAWMGSSGSGVFDSYGNLVGVVSAMPVGFFAVPYPLPDIVIVAEASSIDEKELRKGIKLIKTVRELERETDREIKIMPPQ